MSAVRSYTISDTSPVSKSLSASNASSDLSRGCWARAASISGKINSSIIVLISVIIFCKTTDILRNIGIGECDIIFFCKFTAREKGDHIEPDNR